MRISVSGASPSLARLGPGTPICGPGSTRGILHQRNPRLADREPHTFPSTNSKPKVTDQVCHQCPRTTPGGIFLHQRNPRLAKPRSQTQAKSDRPGLSPVSPNNSRGGYSSTSGTRDSRTVMAAPLPRATLDIEILAICRETALPPSSQESAQSRARSNSPHHTSAFSRRSATALSRPTRTLE